MPLVDVICPQGTLSVQAQEILLSSLWSTALRWEGIEADPTSASIAWVYLDGRPRHRVSVSGKPLVHTDYRINVRLIQGFMEQSRADGMARDLTEAVLAADGRNDQEGPRVFCIVEEIPSGSWSIDGTIWSTVSAATALGLDVDRIAAMERAASDHPRVEVPLLRRLREPA